MLADVMLYENIIIRSRQMKPGDEYTWKRGGGGEERKKTGGFGAVPKNYRHTKCDSETYEATDERKRAEFNAAD